MERKEWDLTEEQYKKYYTLLEIDREIAGDYFDKCLEESMPDEIRKKIDSGMWEGANFDIDEAD